MQIVRLNRVARQAQIQPVADQQFYSREIEVDDKAAEVIARVEREHHTLRAWMDAAYNAKTTPKMVIDVPFPKELLPDDEKKQDKTAGKKAGAKKRVRAGGSGAVAASGS